MHSVNVPVPGRVRRVAADLAPALVGLDRIRDEHTLVVKRLGEVAAPGTTLETIRRALVGVGPVELRLDGVGVFEDPPRGPGPVWYLAVESPDLLAVHDRLVEEFGAVDDLEGADYVPHVTLGRGGDRAGNRHLLDRSVEAVSWTAVELEFADVRDDARVGTVALGER